MSEAYPPQLIGSFTSFAVFTPTVTPILVLLFHPKTVLPFWHPSEVSLNSRWFIRRITKKKWLKDEVCPSPDLALILWPTLSRVVVSIPPCKVFRDLRPECGSKRTPGLKLSFLSKWWSSTAVTTAPNRIPDRCVESVKLYCGQGVIGFKNEIKSSEREFYIGWTSAWREKYTGIPQCPFRSPWVRDRIKPWWSGSFAREIHWILAWYSCITALSKATRSWQAHRAFDNYSYLILEKPVIRTQSAVFL